MKYNRIHRATAYVRADDCRYITDYEFEKPGERPQVLCGICVGTFECELWIDRMDIAMMLGGGFRVW